MYLENITCQVGLAGRQVDLARPLLYTFVYNFISNIHHSNEITSNSPLLYKVGHHKIYTYKLTVSLYLLLPFLRPFYTLIRMNTIRKYLD